MSKEKNTYRFNYSSSNSKMGRISSFNLTPVRTCGENCKYCMGDCYALRGFHNMPSVKAPRDANTDMLFAMEAVGDYTEFIEDVVRYVRENRCRVFRIHESGDMFSAAYARAWYAIMMRCRWCTFWGFTKQFDVLRRVPFYGLDNCNLRLSAWPGLEIPEDLRRHYPVSWLQDGSGSETRIPADAFRCSGGCDTCGHCITGYEDTVLQLHSVGKRQTVRSMLQG